MAETSKSALEQRTFRKLSRLSVLALGAIAVFILLSQILIHQYLDNQESDATVVNVAGRQRMLSQELTNEALQLLIASNAADRTSLKQKIQSTLARWKFSHNALLKGNDSLGLPGNTSEKVTQMFQDIRPYFLKMNEASTAIIGQLAQDPNIPVKNLTRQILIIKTNGGRFLKGMDGIVNQYEREAEKKIQKLKHLELFLMAITLLILLAEIIFIFWPVAKTIKRTIHNLLEAEHHAKKMARNADLLSQAKQKSVKELQVLNEAINKTLLFARISSDGDIIELGEKFSRLFRVQNPQEHLKFWDLLSTEEEERKIIEGLLEENARKNWQGEVKGTIKGREEVWMELSLIPFDPGNEPWEFLVIAVDITTRKTSQLEIERLTQKSFEEKMNQQKLISSKIIENQENEQNRIAKDIHDGIGQMLTALNFNLESIDVNKTEKAKTKIENLKLLTGKLIKGVRTATFNLMPPELSDHGIVPALNKLTAELGKLTGKDILLYNKTGFNERMNSLTEINIYRITQEAINNAIKYADSTHIIVTISHSETLLSIIVDDNGKGFAMKKGKSVRKGEGGMGITFMRERIKYISGRLFINAESGKGTRITLNIPLHS